MQSFEAGFIERQPITQNLLRTIRLIGEYKGKQELFKEQSPQVLETLQQAAIIQSTESSNRIEGVEAPLQRIKALVAQKTTPMNRSEQEIAGYRDVLNTIHANYASIAYCSIRLAMKSVATSVWNRLLSAPRRVITTPCISLLWTGIRDSIPYFLGGNTFLVLSSQLTGNLSNVLVW